MDLKNIFGLGIDKALDSAKSIVTTFVKDKGLQQQIDAEFQKAQMELKSKEMDFNKAMIEAENADRSNARAMNIESMHNSDSVVRRFPIFLASGVLLLSAFVVVALFFVKIPDANRDIVNITIGSLVTGGFGTVLGFYFGSSYHKQDK